MNLCSDAVMWCYFYKVLVHCSVSLLPAESNLTMFFSSLQSYQLGRGSHHVQVTIQMLNEPDLQVLLLATIVVVWSVEAHYQALMLPFMK